MRDILTIYVDGSCVKNGKDGSNGSYGFVVVDNDIAIDAFSSERIDNTTNNREEMKAIIHATKKYGENPILIYSDSSYAVNTFNSWMYSWKANGWLKSNNTVPENLDLVQEYYDLMNQKYKVVLNKVKGHAGEFWNEVADKLATRSIDPDKIIGLDKNIKV